MNLIDALDACFETHRQLGRKELDDQHVAGIRRSILATHHAHMDREEVQSLYRLYVSERDRGNGGGPIPQPAQDDFFDGGAS